MNGSDYLTDVILSGSKCLSATFYFLQKAYVKNVCSLKTSFCSVLTYSKFLKLESHHADI